MDLAAFRMNNLPRPRPDAVRFAGSSLAEARARLSPKERLELDALLESIRRERQAATQ